MISNTLKLAAAVGVAAAMVFSAASAEARVAHRVHHTVAGAHAHHPSYRGSYNYAPAPAGGGFHFRGEPNGSDNYNPNEG